MEAPARRFARGHEAGRHGSRAVSATPYRSTDPVERPYAADRNPRPRSDRGYRLLRRRWQPSPCHGGGGGEGSRAPPVSPPADGGVRQDFNELSFTSHIHSGIKGLVTGEAARLLGWASEIRESVGQGKGGGVGRPNKLPGGGESQRFRGCWKPRATPPRMLAQPGGPWRRLRRGKESRCGRPCAVQIRGDAGQDSGVLLLPDVGKAGRPPRVPPMNYCNCGKRVWRRPLANRVTETELELEEELQDERAYRGKVQHLAVWCADNNLALSTQKTKEIIVDFRHARSHTHVPIHINGAVVEHVSSFKFLGVHISEDLTWSLNSSILVRKAQRHLYFLRSMKKAHLCPRILTDFYCCTTESILTNCISVWYGNCPVSDCKALQRVVETAQRIIGT
ncbi:uncharacterized protein [Mobula birostris]|uniref:uncharacterized protein n=1 Tax=Mobula birostris TaxID=1983395 RepID=UPI003B28D4D9